MTTIHLGPPLLMGSSHLPARIRRDTFSRTSLSRAYLVLLRVEVTAFHILSHALGRLITRLCGPIPRLGWAEAHLLRTAVSRHPTLRSPDLPLPTHVGSDRPAHFLLAL
jgi:hypothetical protein